MQYQHLFGKYVLFTLLIIISASIVQCGGETGVIQQVEFKITPQRPIVIDSNFSYPVTDQSGKTTIRKVKAPWFSFSYYIKNNSNKTITINNYKITVTGKKNGQQLSTEHSLELGELRYPSPNADKTVLYLEEIGPGESASNFTDTKWVIESLSEDVESRSYSVKIEVQGWVGEWDSPERRLPIIRNFNTQ